MFLHRQHKYLFSPHQVQKHFVRFHVKFSSPHLRSCCSMTFASIQLYILPLTLSTMFFQSGGVARDVVFLVSMMSEIRHGFEPVSSSLITNL